MSKKDNSILQSEILDIFDKLSNNYGTKADFIELKTKITQIDKKVFYKENSIRNRVIALEKTIKNAKSVIIWLFTIIALIISGIIVAYMTGVLNF